MQLSTDLPSQSPIEQDLGFDTEDIDPAHRVEAYRSLYAAGGDVEILGPRFRAAMRVRRCGGLMLYHRVLSDVAHRRDAERVRQCGFDHFTAQLNVRGLLQVQADGLRRIVAPGEILFLDMTRPFRHVVDGEIVTVSIPRAFIAERCAQPTSLHGAVAAAFHAAPLVQWMTRFWSSADGNEASDIEGLMSALDTALRGAAARPIHQRREQDAIRRDRIRGVIERDLGDPDLTPERVAAEVCLSRATLYRMFQDLGTPSSWRQARRLWRFRQVLASGPHSIGDAAEAAGITDPSYASALFSRALGMTPSGYRREVERVLHDSDRPGALRWIMKNVPVLLSTDVH
ncbi:MAG: helix-turn-helix domain-containing protein [Caulobacteraceae bacterium]